MISEDEKMEGQARIVDKHNGMYDVFYCVPYPGEYLVHVTHEDLGEKPEDLPIRGSPFRVHCKDPWSRHRVMGSTPSKRKGVQVSALGDELLVYGASDSGVCVCNTDGQDWKWVVVSADGEGPKDGTVLASAALENGTILYGGENLATDEENKMMISLERTDAGFCWKTIDEQPHFW